MGADGARKRKIAVIAALAAAVVLLALLELLVGSSGMSVRQCVSALFGSGDSAAVRIMQHIRLPRLLAAVIAGAGLSVSGLIMQTVLGNPMASPATLGVSNAAVFGANLSIIALSGGFLSTGNNLTSYTAGADPFATSALAFVFAAGSVLVVLALCRSKDIFRLELKQVRFHRDALELLLKIGLPAGLQSVMYSASNIIIQTSLNSFGTNTMAAWTAYGKIDSFFWMVISAFGISITTFVGQNYGARKFGRMRKSVRVCLGMAFGTAIVLSLRICIGMAMGASVVISAVFMIFGKYVYQMFTTDATVIEIGMHMMTLMAPAYAVYVFIEVYSGALRGTGDVLVPMLMTCGGVCVLRVLWVWFIVPLKPVIDTILYSYPISWTLTALLFIFYYRKKCQQFPDSDE